MDSFPSGRKPESAQVAILAALYHFTDRLYHAQSLPEVYEATFDALSQALRCARASILLFDNAGVMRFVASRGLSEAYCAAVNGHSPWKAGEHDPRPIFVNDISNTDEPDSIKSALALEKIRAIAFIPLVSDRRVIGKFMTYYERPHSFTPDEVDLALTIARQLGFSIERARADAARRTAERSFRESEERQRQIIDSAKEYAIITIDPSRGIRSWNKGAERLLGYKEADILGRSGDLFFTPEDVAAGVPEVEMRAARVEGRAANERWHVRKDGSRFWGSGVMLPLENGDREMYLKIFRDQTEEREAGERQKLLIGELNHRVKNTLATVLSLAQQTLKSADTPKAFASAFKTRLLALAAAHDLLTRENWEGASIKNIAEAVLHTWIEEERALLSGPEIRIRPKQALALAMAYNELLTNAMKYGALSAPGGRVLLTWDCDPNCTVRWSESGGPRVVRPERQGFGLRVLTRALPGELGGPVHLGFEPGGLECTIGLGTPSAQPIEHEREKR